MSLLVVGSVAFDSIETPWGKANEVLGGSATFFSAAASFFSPVRLVAVVGTDFPETHINYLQSRGVDLTGLKRTEGSTFRWAGKYSQNMDSRETLFTQLNVFSHFCPEIPLHYRDSKLIFLGNIDPVLQLQVLDQVTAPALVACDTMNFWITGALEALKEVISRVQVLIINDEELRMLSGQHNILKAARIVQQMGPKILVVKRGENGALLFCEDSAFVAPAFLVDTLTDPTGAGDTFAGGFMGQLAREEVICPAAIRRAMVMGTIMASFCVEDFSLDRLRTLTMEEIQHRLLLFKDFTSFECHV